MLWKEITIGFLLAGFVAQLADDFFNGLFVPFPSQRSCGPAGSACSPSSSPT
jgi:hypothetical protein